jgi:hypothetical protein
MMDSHGIIPELVAKEDETTARGAWLGGRFWDGFAGRAATSKQWGSGEGWYTNDGRVVHIASFEARNSPWAHPIEYTRKSCMLMLSTSAPQIQLTSKCSLMPAQHGTQYHYVPAQIVKQLTRLNHAM